MQYKIEKAPKGFDSLSRTNTRKLYPITELKVGEMFRANVNERTNIYNAIKHRRNYSKEIEGRIFTVKKFDEKTVFCIRIK